MDVKCSIPTFIKMIGGKVHDVHDVNIWDSLILEVGFFYVMDRGYLDFTRLYAIAQLLAFFVIRTKSNLINRKVYSCPVDKSTGLRYDQTIFLTGVNTSEQYPEKLREIRYVDQETSKDFVFLTNNYFLPVLNIASISAAGR